MFSRTNKSASFDSTIFEHCRGEDICGKKTFYSGWSQGGYSAVWVHRSELHCYADGESPLLSTVSPTGMFTSGRVEANPYRGFIGTE